MSAEITDDDTRKLVASMNKFAVSLYVRIADGMAGKNILSSPISVFTTLAITYLGAKNNTAKQLATIAGFSEVPCFHQTFEGYLKRTALLSSEGMIIKLANYVLGKTGVDIQDVFVEGCKKHYGTDVQASDFNEPIEVCSAINKRVIGDTNGRIQDLLQNENIKPDTEMLFINAIYFKSDWLAKFKPEASNVMPFRVNAQTTMEAEMMSLTEKFNFGGCRSLRCQVLELPFRNKNLSMVILLPLDDDGISALENGLTNDAMGNIFQNLISVKVHVTIPRGHMGCKLQLKPVLQQLGVTDLFDTCKVDLSGIQSSRSLFISDVIQKSFIEVTEKGTEATSATAVVTQKRTMSRVERFNADHPFIFLIKENITDGILLMGRYMAPE